MGKQGGNHSVALLGVLVVSGVITFMALVGIVFTFLLGAGVNRAVETVSPVAFLLLLGVGAVLMVAPAGFGRYRTSSRHIPIDRAFRRSATDSVSVRSSSHATPD